MAVGEKPVGVADILSPRLWLAVSLAIAGAATIEALGRFLAYTNFPGMSWLDNVGEIAAPIATGVAFSYLLAALAGLAARRVAGAPGARTLLKAIAALSAVAGVLGLIGIWHFLSFRLHGTDTNSSLNVTFGGYPWRARLQGVLEGVAAIGLALVTIWIVLSASPTGPSAPTDDSEPEPVELTPMS